MKTLENSPVKQESSEKLDKVLFERVPEMATAYISINNGENNIMSLEVLGELEKCIDELKNDKEIRYVIFHAGSGYFSTGANIREMSELSREEAVEYSRYGQSIMKSIQDLDQITIAVIPKGFCVGGGLELSMSCKYRVANDGSIFQMPERKLGIIPGWRGTQTLPYHMGAKAAEDWINNNGKSMKAEKAYELGLIDYIFDNPLGKTNSMIKDEMDFVSRSKHDPEKMTLDGKKIENDEDEMMAFAEGWKNGTPLGMLSFLEKQKNKN